MKENVNYYSNRKENLCFGVNLEQTQTRFFIVQVKHKFTVILCTESNENIEIQNFI